MKQTLKRAIVGLIGRDLANRLSGPYHDWKARRQTLQQLAQLPGTDLLVNFGCGPSPLAGWINVDIARWPGVQIIWDLRRGLPFPNESCTAVFGEHVIEHVRKGDAERLLRECHRVLQKDGVLRLSTPDAGRYLRSYAGDGEFLRHPAFAETFETPLDRVNQMMREDGQHHWVYDGESLMLLLKKIGFTSVVEQQFGQSIHPKMIGIDADRRAFESLYVEAVK